MKLLKKILPIVLVLATVLALVPMTVSADTWDGTTVASGFESGDGTEANPYIIKTAAQLAYLAVAVNGTETVEADSFEGKYIKLDADIDLGGKAWTTIGLVKDTPFSGIFDGNDHIISGLYIETPTAVHTGLFGRTYNATIQNLSLLGTKVVGGQYTGALVAMATYGTQIINCYVKVDSVQGEAVGGIVGRAEKKSEDDAKRRNNIILCTFDGLTVYGESGWYSADRTAYVGGIVGVAGDSAIRYCINNADVSMNGKTKTGADIGGILGCHGASSGDVIVDHCINTGDIDIKENGKAGGIIGKANHVEGGKINYCINLGQVTGDGTSTYVGALVGDFAKNSGEAGYHHNVSVKVGDLKLEGSDEVGKDSTNALINDDFYADLSRSCLFVELADVTGAGAIGKIKGYMADYWTDGTTIPQPKKDAILAKIAEDGWYEKLEAEAPATTEAVTTETPEDTGTEAPEDTGTEAPEDSDTNAPAGTQAPAATTEAPSEGGCGSMVSGSLAVVALVTLAGVMLKKKD